MSNSVKTTVSGYYGFAVDREVSPGVWKRVKSIDRCNNVITDAGLRYIAANGERPFRWVDKCAVGFGSAAPTATDTELTNTSVKANMPKPEVTALKVDPYTRSLLSSCTFNKGAITGNVTEVGMYCYDDTLFSRTLVKDENDSPVALTLTSKDVLTITYTFEATPPTSDTNWSLTLDGTAYSGIFRPMGLANGIPSSPYTDDGVFYSTYGRFGTGAKIGVGSLVDKKAVNDVPEDMEVYLVSTAVTGDPYSRDLTCTFSPSQGNAENTLLVLAGDNYGGGIAFCAWQMSIDPPLIKTDTYELSFTFRVNIGRA